jgi:hypothetical protein
MTDEQVARLREVFQLVQNADHWKNPIDAEILRADATTDEIREAVIFFTGSVPKISPCHVSATGWSNSWRPVTT